jgi:hypothetical protein
LRQYAMEAKAARAGIIGLLEVEHRP